jgi:hypothetical protein
VLVIDIAEYDRFYKKLIAITPISDVSPNFGMERAKYPTGIPPELAESNEVRPARREFRYHSPSQHGDDRCQNDISGTARPWRSSHCWQR